MRVALEVVIALLFVYGFAFLLYYIKSNGLQAEKLFSKSLSKRILNLFNLRKKEQEFS